MSLLRSGAADIYDLSGGGDDLFVDGWIGLAPVGCEGRAVVEVEGVVEDPSLRKPGFDMVSMPLGQVRVVAVFDDGARITCDDSQRDAGRR